MKITVRRTFFFFFLFLFKTHDRRRTRLLALVIPRRTYFPSISCRRESPTVVSSSKNNDAVRRAARCIRRLLYLFQPSQIYVLLRVQTFNRTGHGVDDTDDQKIKRFKYKRISQRTFRSIIKMSNDLKLSNAARVNANLVFIDDRFRFQKSSPSCKSSNYKYRLSVKYKNLTSLSYRNRFEKARCFIFAN